MYSSCSFRLLPILVPLKSNGRIKQIKKVPKLQILKIKKMTAYLIHSTSIKKNIECTVSNFRWSLGFRNWQT